MMTIQAMKKPTLTLSNAHDDLLAPAVQEQWLSALIDGELSDDMARQTLKRLDHAATGQLADYLAIGDAMRGLPEQPGDFTRRVMAALENEPVVLAPMRKPATHRPVLWLAAATVAAISWGLWPISPHNEAAAPEAALQQAATPIADAQPYLAAHQDFAQALPSTPEMHFTKVALEIPQ
jgi:negative regulator of sigma E activity